MNHFQISSGENVRPMFKILVLKRLNGYQFEVTLHELGQFLSVVAYDTEEKCMEDINKLTEAAKEGNLYCKVAAYDDEISYDYPIAATLYVGGSDIARRDIFIGDPATEAAIASIKECSMAPVITKNF